jgi:amidase
MTSALAVELAALDAVAQAELCRSGQVTSAELVNAARERIEALDGLLRAVVHVADHAAPLGASGPLFGVPLLLKDSLPWPDMPWTMGSRLFTGRVTRQQTEYGERLAQSGAAVLGKTALSEFGLLGSCEGLLHGVTCNPWRLSSSTLGSSAGSAVAVAAGMVPIAHANDGGGSVRVPAAMAGIFGFKPSRGRTLNSNRSGSDFSQLTVDHCLSRSVRDSALFLSLTEDKATFEPVGFVREPSNRRLKIASWTKTLSDEEPESEIVSAHEDVCRLLHELGHDVQPIAAPRFEMPELGWAHYLVAADGLNKVVETIDRTRREPVQRDELEPFSWSLLEELKRRPAALAEARATFERASQAYRTILREYDVVLTPVTTSVEPPLGWLSPLLDAETLLRRSGRALGYTPIHNLAGGPAMSVPLAWTAAGLPVGAHFAAALGADALLLQLAYELEQARPWRDRWPFHSIVELERGLERRTLPSL